MGKKVDLKDGKILTKEDLINIADSLTYLASKETSAWYEIGKNLRLLKPFMKDVEGVRTDIKENCAKKDAKGHFIFKDLGKGFEEIVWKNKESEKKQAEIWKKFISEEAPKIDFCKFSVELLEGVKLNAGLASNLIDIILE